MRRLLVQFDEKTIHRYLQKGAPWNATSSGVGIIEHNVTK